MQTAIATQQRFRVARASYLLTLVTSVLLCLTGCFGKNLKPTVELLKETIQTLRKDYAEGKVTLHPKPALNTRLVAGRLERIDAAILNADAAISDTAPITSE